MTNNTCIATMATTASSDHTIPSHPHNGLTIFTSVSCESRSRWTDTLITDQALSSILTLRGTLAVREDGEDRRQDNQLMIGTASAHTHKDTCMPSIAPPHLLTQPSSVTTLNTIYLCTPAGLPTYTPCMTYTPCTLSTLSLNPVIQPCHPTLSPNSVTQL